MQSLSDFLLSGVGAPVAVLGAFVIFALSRDWLSWTAQKSKQSSSDAPATSTLDPLYKLTAFLAVTALVGIAAIILADVILRQFGGQVKSSDDFAGFALVATGMLGLAPTYRRGEHIRVGLLIDRLQGGSRRTIEILCLVFGVTAIGWASWWAGRFVYDSWRFHEVSQGLVAIPLWVPQFFMFFGLFMLFVAMLEDLIRVLTGRSPSYLANVPAEAELPSFER